jgi:hypothetical protein
MSNHMPTIRIVTALVVVAAMMPVGVMACGGCDSGPTRQTARSATLPAPAETTPLAFDFEAFSESGQLVLTKLADLRSRLEAMPETQDSKDVRPYFDEMRAQLLSIEERMTEHLFMDQRLVDVMAQESDQQRRQSGNDRPGGGHIH